MLKVIGLRIFLDPLVVNILSHLPSNENESQDLNLGSVALESVPLSRTPALMQSVVRG